MKLECSDSTRDRREGEMRGEEGAGENEGGYIAWTDTVGVVERESER